MSPRSTFSYPVVISTLGTFLLYRSNPLVPINVLIFIFTYILLITLILLLFYSIILYPYYLSPLRHLPAATQKPLHQRIFNEPNAFHFERWINELPNEPCIRYLGFLNTERLFLTTPTGVNHILRLQANVMEKQPTARRILQKVAGMTGLVVTDGMFHKCLRKALDPAFKVGMIRDAYHPLFWSKAGKMMEIVQTEHGNQKTSSKMIMDDIVGRTVFDIIDKASMNHDWKALQSPNTYWHRLRGFRSSFKPSADTKNWIILSFVFPAWILDQLPIRFNKITKKGIQKVRSICRDSVMEKINPLRAIYQDQESLDRLSHGEEKKEVRNDEANSKSVLDFAVRTRVSGSSSFKMDSEQLIDQVVMLQTAGAHSAVTGLLSSIYFLALHPLLQDKLREEIRATVPPPDATINSPPRADILQHSMPYLNAVINEVLRLQSAFSWTGRIPITPITIPGVNVVIPAGTALSISPWAMHRSYALWGADAKEFKPERWLPDHHLETSKVPRDLCSYIAFGAGPQKCIGENFALAEMRCIISALCGQYKIKFADQKSIPSITHQLTVSFRSSMEVEIEEVEGW